MRRTVIFLTLLVLAGASSAEVAQAQDSSDDAREGPPVLREVRPEPPVLPAASEDSIVAPRTEANDDARKAPPVVRQEKKRASEVVPPPAGAGEGDIRHVTPAGERAAPQRGIRATDVQAFQERRKDALAQMQAKRLAFQDALREERNTLKQTIREKRGKLSERLERIKDEKKRQRVSRVDREVDALNARVMRSLTIAIDRLEHIADRIAERMEKVRANSVDVTDLERSLAATGSAIAAARSAVREQSGRTYEILVSDEATLRGDVQRVRRSLHADVSAAREQLRAAHDAIQRTVEQLKLIPNVNALSVVEVKE
jgi:hypothetical protein